MDASKTGGAGDPRDCRDGTRSSGGARAYTESGLQSVPLETNRLSTASRRVEPLVTRPHGVSTEFLASHCVAVTPESRVARGTISYPRKTPSGNDDPLNRGYDLCNARMRYAVMLLLRGERRSDRKKHESKQQDAKKFALKRIWENVGIFH